MSVWPRYIHARVWEELSMSYDLLQELRNKTDELILCLKQLRTNGIQLAEAEKAYKIKLREEALRLRDEKMPVTLIDKVIYGVPEVAELRFKRDIADTVYQANIEAINSTKLQMRIIENQIAREWSSRDGGL